jgi:glycosyltransferase involved in cell wall biosynthesis
MKKIIWLTWEKQIRNRSMSRELDVNLFEILTRKKFIFRYLVCIGKTLTTLIREKPNVVICQNPSLILTFILINLKSLLKFKVCIDAHYCGVNAQSGFKIKSQAILNWCNRTADLVIVTNISHANYINRLGGKTFICPDPFPGIKRYQRKVPVTPKKILLICSYHEDEPYYEVFKAAKLLISEGFCFYISGNYKKAGILPSDFPYIKFLGYVPEDIYYSHIFSSQIIMDLTSNENCLVCGAYEALEAGKPTILSKTKALKEYFTGGTVFTENDAHDIAEAVVLTYAQREILELEARRWVSSTNHIMRQRISELKFILDDI